MAANTKMKQLFSQYSKQSGTWSKSAEALVRQADGVDKTREAIQTLAISAKTKAKTELEKDLWSVYENVARDELRPTKAASRIALGYARVIDKDFKQLAKELQAIADKVKADAVQVKLAAIDVKKDAKKAAADAKAAKVQEARDLAQKVKSDAVAKKAAAKSASVKKVTTKGVDTKKVAVKVTKTPAAPEKKVAALEKKVAAPKAVKQVTLAEGIAAAKTVTTEVEVSVGPAPTLDDLLNAPQTSVLS